MTGECEKRGITIDRHLDTSGEPLQSLDPHQMEQVFVNILKNATAAIGEHGKIVLRLENRDRGLVVLVEDSGSGINPDVRQMIFTPFFSTKENG